MVNGENITLMAARTGNGKAVIIPAVKANIIGTISLLISIGRLRTY